MEVTNIEVGGFKAAIRGMRNPLDSWNRSDSEFFENCIVLGKKDQELAARLIKAGPEHCKFLRQINVTMDIAAPRYWWSEMDTYKIGTCANSCSTMHRLSTYPITREMFALDSGIDEEFFSSVIQHLESLRQQYNKTKDFKYFRLLKQELPESFIQKRTWSANYAVLRNIFSQRTNHRLIEWIQFFEEIKFHLPYFNEFIGGTEK